MLKRFLTPRWIGWHALLVVAVLVLGRVGLWQWREGRGDGDWQNYGYAVQWWLFAAFAVFLWVKLVLDELDPSRVADREAKAAVPPVVQRQAPPPAEDEDDELAAYNRHLAWLAQQNADR